MGCSASKPGNVLHVHVQDGKCRPALADLTPYQPAQLPFEEQERLHNLWSLNILDTPADPHLDGITQLLCKIFNMPISIISLVDQYRCWLKSQVGMPIEQADRDISMCSWTVIPAHAEMLIIEDASKDGRFKNCPLVTGPPNVRFYAAAPLITSMGYLLGALCVIDTKPRKFDAEKCNVLANFGEIVVRQIEKTTSNWVRNCIASQKATRSLIRALDCFQEGIVLVRFDCDGGCKVVYSNDAWTEVTGVAESDAVGADVRDFADVNQELKAMLSTVVAKQPSQFKMTLHMKASKRLINIAFRSARTDPLNENMPLVGIPSNISWDPKSFADNLYFGTARRSSTENATVELLKEKLSIERKSSSVPDEMPFDGVIKGPLVGCGSFGKVYRASYFGSPVALKVVLFDDTDTVGSGGKPSSKLEQSLFDINLSHPNIVRTYKTLSKTIQITTSAPWSTTSAASDSSSFDDSALGPRSHSHSGDGSSPRGPLDSAVYFPSYQREIVEAWIMMEFCDMGTLTEAIERGWFKTPRCTPGAAPDIDAIILTARQIASALAYLHSRNIVHGDLTGGNVLLCSSKLAGGFSIKISDFGLSRFASEGMILTNTTGTPTHMPPELLAEGLFSKAVDVYAFGVMLWEMYNGKRAWAGMQAVQIIFNVAVKKKVLEFPEDTPAKFKEVVLRCLAPTAAERPSFEEILKIIEEQYGNPGL